MTFRLIGLMSFVLLLCLGAVVFLLNQYQNQVMEEVAQTVSSVGRQTLRTLEYQSLHRADPDQPEVSFRTHVRHSDQVLSGDGAVESSLRLPEGHWEGVVVFSRGFTTIADCAEKDPATCDDAQLWASSPEAVRRALPERLAKMFPSPSEIVISATGGDLRAERVFIQVEDIRTEGDFEGMVLRIPTLIQVARQFNSETEPGSTDELHAQTSTGAGGNNLSSPLHQRAFMLPIDTQDFQTLFSGFRRRSILLLLGVFLLGTVLSASLASRFTRPIRRLDAGIRRLAQGDLDVEVDVRGRDEIARLARTFNDMTQRLRTGREREREFTRREKLSALGRLAAGVAHDVRNPLHSISLTLQHLRETCRPRETERGVEFDRSLGIIREEIRRLGRLVENFLRFARTDQREKAPLQVPDLLRETAQLVEKEAARRGVAIEVKIDEPVSDVVADAESVRSSILNLVLNSFEAMPEGGRLTLAVRQQGRDVLIEVVDSGSGIPLEEQERVFDFAYTTRDSGHGLGLAMVHQVVVEDHGGRVTLESKPGEGTKVLLAFPIPEGGVSA